MLQNQFDFAIGYCTVADEFNDLLWDGHLGVAIEHFNNVVRLQPHGNGGVERVGREFVLMDKGRASERLALELSMNRAKATYRLTGSLIATRKS
jgi:hypothetical protein